MALQRVSSIPKRRRPNFGGFGRITAASLSSRHPTRFSGKDTNAGPILSVYSSLPEIKGVISSSSTKELSQSFKNNHHNNGKQKHAELRAAPWTLPWKKNRTCLTHKKYMYKTKARDKRLAKVMKDNQLIRRSRSDLAARVCRLSNKRKINTQPLPSPKFFSHLCLSRSCQSTTGGGREREIGRASSFGDSSLIWSIFTADCNGHKTTGSFSRSSTGFHSGPSRHRRISAFRWWESRPAATFIKGTSLCLSAFPSLAERIYNLTRWSGTLSVRLWCRAQGPRSLSTVRPPLLHKETQREWTRRDSTATIKTPSAHRFGCAARRSARRADAVRELEAALLKSTPPRFSFDTSAAVSSAAPASKIFSAASEHVGKSSGSFYSADRLPSNEKQEEEASSNRQMKIKERLDK